jgi:uncharacterized protein DUF3311
MKPRIFKDENPSHQKSTAPRGVKVHFSNRLLPLQFSPALCNSTQAFRRRLQPRMRRALLVTVVGALYVLHQDFWYWRTAGPLVFGFLPIGLFYHACFTIATSLALMLLVRQAWPSHLEQAFEHAEADAEPPTGRSFGNSEFDSKSRPDDSRTALDTQEDKAR